MGLFDEPPWLSAMVPVQYAMVRETSWHEDLSPMIESHTTLEALRARYPLEAACIAKMTGKEREMMLRAMERGFARSSRAKPPWWRRLLGYVRSYP